MQNSIYLWLIVAFTLIVLSACAFQQTTALTEGEAAVEVESVTPLINETRKVLLIPREGSASLAYMLTHEVEVMTSMLEDAGFEVVSATASGKPLISKMNGSMPFEPDLKLADVEVSEYVGVIMPCMAAGIPGPVPEEAVAIVKEAVAEGKPVAAQYGSVTILGVAGVLGGKKYTYANDRFQEGYYVAGYGVVQDGNIITSGTCPYMALSGRKDGTQELTAKLIQSLNSN